MILPPLKLLQVLALTTVTSLSTTVLAQPGNSGRRGGGFTSTMSAGGMDPDYMLRDLQRFQVALELSDEQTLLVEQFLRDYDESFREASDASRDSVGNSFSSMRGNEDSPEQQRTDELRARSRELREKLDSANSLGDEEGMKELQAKLQSEMESIRDEMREARTEQWQSPERQSAFEDVALLLQDQLRLKRKMRIEFESDLVIILSEDQQLLWPPLERQIIRDRLLPRGRLSGETIDIMSFVDQQEYADETLITLLPVLEEWDMSVTPALSARDEHMIENQGSLMTAMRTMDMTAGLDVMKAQARHAENVRDISDTAIENIVLLLSPEDGEVFNAFAKERSYPRIYRPTRTDRAYKAAMELEGLEEDILQAINELYAALQDEMIYANQQILEATHRWESQEQLDRMNRFAQRMTGGSSERAASPIQEAEEGKRVIEENYLEQLRMLLTEEQIEALGGLQKREARGEGGQRGADGGGREGGRGGFEGGREEFMKRFDADGDGTISESERNAIRDHFRNGGGDSGGGQGGRGGNGGGQGSGGGGRP